jgi:thymidylate synthase (FAD)
MTVEIRCSRAIAAQLLRHRSFCFQEFSTRYAVVDRDYSLVEAREQDPVNRQNSLDTLDQATKDWFTAAQNTVFDEAYSLYEEALAKGIAKECARNLLPLATMTRLYMTGNVRSWIHYLQTRLDKSTQLEHRKIAEEIHAIFSTKYPTISNLMEKSNEWMES